LNCVQAGDALIQLYNNFISDFETKINLLKLAHFAVIVSHQYTDKDSAINYLEGVIRKLRETGELRIEEPVLYVKMQIVALHLEKGNQKDCKKLLEEGKSTLDSMTDVDPSVHASFYWISSQYHKSHQEFSEFYKSALLYLAYTSVESLSESFKLVMFARSSLVGSLPRIFSIIYALPKFSPTIIYPSIIQALKFVIVVKSCCLFFTISPWVPCCDNN
jgi:26S proteasome regulatory subunit N9